MSDNKTTTTTQNDQSESDNNNCVFYDFAVFYSNIHYSAVVTVSTVGVIGHACVITLLSRKTVSNQFIHFKIANLST